MNEEKDELGYNRRDFLKGGSVATLMTMLGGVELLAQTNQPAKPDDLHVQKTTVAVIGLGAWGREIVNALHGINHAELAGLCDSYEAWLKRTGKDYSAVFQTKNYAEILAKREIKTVIIATPTHLHKEIAIAALKAGKHVYCEMPLAHTLEDARAIAEAAKATPKVIFQAGLQLRSDEGRRYALEFFRSGAIGRPVMARAQWHKKSSWRLSAGTPEREKALNWRLDKDLSLGLAGEVGLHQIDQTNWFLNAMPVAVNGFGTIALYNDGRQVPDTVQAVLEYPDGVRMVYDATLANSFDAAYEVVCGGYASIMVRDDREWLFQEVDSPQMGWEVYARKESFYKTNGIVLAANASKLVAKAKGGAAPAPEVTPLQYALDNFLQNSMDLDNTLAAGGDVIDADPDALKELLKTVKKRAAAGFKEGLQATIVGIKTNEAIVSGKRVELKPEMYQLA